MKHLGDITKVRGDKVPAVDCITGGSPCQDLSVAGKRIGLAGERSGLFMEQIRIIKEMRVRDREDGRTGSDIRPRFMVWENVPGAFSTNKGEDFRAVLQETVKVVCPEAPIIPMPKRGWPCAGCLIGLEGKWSVAWRVHDAKFWGVPQRRKRIALVADFAGGSAGKILFESEGVSGYTPQGFRSWQRAAGTFEKGSGAAGCVCLNNQGGVNEDVSSTLDVIDRHAVAYCMTTGTYTQILKEQSPTLMARDYKGPPIINETKPEYSVRRLTPLEYERLQGYPDGWTDIGDWMDTKGKKRKTSDSIRYKSIGNSIALPFWQWLTRRISAQYDRPATLGSLFDGIGGFPYCWERCNGRGTAIWASEIDEFCIAVTERRINSQDIV